MVDSLVLRNARLFTGALDADPQTIAITDGVIAQVGPPVRPLPSSPSSSGIETLDLDGRWVLPGLWDHHVHFQQWAISRDRHDLSEAESAAAAAHTIGELIGPLHRGADRRDLIVGVGYRDALWPDRPTAELLDRHTGDVAAVLVSADLHSAWLNTAALLRYGVASAHPSGLLREQPAFDIQLAIADLLPARVDTLISDAMTAAAQRGVVGIVDFEWPDIGPVWQRRLAARPPALRVVCSVWPENLHEAGQRGLRTGDPIAGTSGFATMGPLKVIIDGSLNTRTAYCFDAYVGLGNADARGLLTVAPEQLIELLREAKRLGLSSAVHAIGDHANAIALNAFDDLGAERSAGNSIEHAQLVTVADMNRMAALGLIASVQPEHAVDDRDVADRYWPGRTERAFAYRSLADAGVTLAFGSDAPVAPLDPWIAIAAAVHRSRGERPPWHPEQQLTLTEAVRASVRHGIAPGAPADLVIVDRDPGACSPEQLRTMPVVATLLGGHWTHRS